MEELQELVASRRPSSETVNDPQKNNTDREKKVRKEEHEDDRSPTLWISSVPARTTTEDEDADLKEQRKEEHADDVSAASEGEPLSQIPYENNTTKDGNGEVDRDEDVDNRSFPSSGLSKSSDRTPATTGLLTNDTIANHCSNLEETTADPACPIVPTMIPNLLPSGLGFDAERIPDMDSNVDRSKCQDDEEETAARVGIYHDADANVPGDVMVEVDGNRKSNTEEYLLIPTFPGGDVTKIAFQKSFLLSPVIPGRTTKTLWRSRL